MLGCGFVLFLLDVMCECMVIYVMLCVNVMFEVCVIVCIEELVEVLVYVECVNLICVCFVVVVSYDLL